MKLNLKKIVHSRSEVTGLLQSAGDAVVIKRGEPRWLLLKCPCGCNEEFPVNLDERAGPAWRIYTDPRTGVSVFPSIVRDTGCRSHFIILRNTIFLFSHSDEPWGTHGEDALSIELKNKVRAQLPSIGLVSYVTIADRLGEIPWDVLDMCRRLVLEGHAREGAGKQQGHFGLATHRTAAYKRTWSA